MISSPEALTDQVLTLGESRLRVEEVLQLGNQRHELGANVVLRAVEIGDEQPKDEVVLKIGSSDSPAVEQAFHRERVVRDILTDGGFSVVPYVPTAKEIVLPNGDCAPVLAMPYYQNGSAENVKIDRENRANVFRNMANIANALIGMHREGFIDRDVKPSNMIIGPDGKWLLNDFELTVNEGFFDLNSKISGSVRYVSPERRLGGSLRESDDVFSMGNSLLYFITGGATSVFKEFAGRKDLSSCFPDKFVAAKAKRDPQSIAYGQEYLEGRYVYENGLWRGVSASHGYGTALPEGYKDAAREIPKPVLDVALHAQDLAPNRPTMAEFRDVLLQAC